MSALRTAFARLLAIVIAAVTVNALNDVQAAPPQASLPIGSPAPDFALPGVDDRVYRLNDFDDAEVLVVIFTCNHCPTAQAYESRIQQLHDDYKDRGVALVAISPNDPLAVRLDELGYTDVGDSFEDMKIRAKNQGFTFPYLYDGETQSVSRAFGVLATPHVYIFDDERMLQYNGRIDNAEVGEVTKRDTRAAIEALLAGEPVPTPTTRVFGCSTKWAEKRPAAVASLERWNKEPVTLETIDADEVRELVANPTDKLRLINLWATWCGPCVAELPEFVTMHRMYRGRDFELITLSLDEPSARDKALEVLTRHHVSATNYLVTEQDQDVLAEALDPEWPGPIPYTIVVAPGGEIIYRHVNEIEPLALKRVLADTLGRTYADR